MSIRPSRITINLSTLRAFDFWISSSGRAVAEFEDENGDEILFEVERNGNTDEIDKLIENDK
jgi:hypothetical protein